MAEDFLTNILEHLPSISVPPAIMVIVCGDNNDTDDGKDADEGDANGDSGGNCDRGYLREYMAERSRGSRIQTRRPKLLAVNVNYADEKMIQGVMERKYVQEGEQIEAEKLYFLKTDMEEGSDRQATREKQNYQRKKYKSAKNIGRDFLLLDKMYDNNGGMKTNEKKPIAGTLTK